MAINFISHDDGNTLLIGGQSALGGANSGNIGPFPRYSINREDLKTGDGTYINSKFTINITGTAVLSAYNTADLTTKGQRQKDIQGLALISLKFNKQDKMLGHGKLEISPYGGMPNSIVFNDAKLVSLELPEQNEESAGTQYLEYNFVFEAYDDASDSTNAEWGLAVDQPDYKLLSTTESWDLQANDDQFVFKDKAINDKQAQYKTFTLRHTLTAVGLKKFNNNQIDNDDGHAWRQAAKWVKDRLEATYASANNPDKATVQDLFANNVEIIKNFHPFYFKHNSEKDLFDLKTEPYKARNKTRTITSDIAAGSYSVTDSWILSLNEIDALHEVDVNITNAIDSPNVTITVNGTVTGLNTLDIDKNYQDKYESALKEYKAYFDGADNILSTKIGLVASDVYSDYNAIGKKSGTLVPKAINHSESHDKTNGTIAWTVVFSDDDAAGANGAIYKDIKYSFENHQYRTYENDLPSVIEVVERGPYIYDPRTTNEKKLKVDVELQMDFQSRSTKPDGMLFVSLPTLIWVHHAPRITSHTESWNPKSGQYSMNVEYTYV